MSTHAPGTVTRALLSVYDKHGLLELAQGLAEAGVELLASGGTAKLLRDNGLKVVPVESFTGAPEVLEGRVKTLHPRIHAGVLADRTKPQHLADLAAQDYPTIDLVICNLYPFHAALARGADRKTMIENIDVGGPTMVRAAAKNVDGGATIVVDPADYPRVLEAVQRDKAVPLKLRRELAAKAFALTAAYDSAVAAWHARENDPEAVLPPMLPAAMLVETLRYGENPHQAGARYVLPGESSGIARGELLHGKQLSYNNLLDMDAAYRAVCLLAEPACVIVKHTNPCGMAEAHSQPEAFTRALAGDPLSAFGGILGFNTPVNGATAAAIKESKLFVECIVAPEFDPEARVELERRENLRLFVVPEGDVAGAWHAHRIGGGWLVESHDPGVPDPSTWQVVTRAKLEPTQLEELLFAMRAAMVLKSNAIAITRDRALVGAGAGFMSRVDAVEQAVKKAGDKARGAFLASDAFFPFDDSVRRAHEAGIAAIVQPGGSKRDDEVIRACDELGIAMAFTGRRHFRH